MIPEQEIERVLERLEVLSEEVATAEQVWEKATRAYKGKRDIEVMKARRDGVPATLCEAAADAQLAEQKADFLVAEFKWGRKRLDLNLLQAMLDGYRTLAASHRQVTG